jgi:Fe-S-cluster containining protein
MTDPGRSSDQTPPPVPVLFRQAEDWFQRARASLLGSLPCGQGCSHCCIGPFTITILDRLELQRGLRSIPPAVRADIIERARTLAVKIEGAFPPLNHAAATYPDEIIDQIVEQFQHSPCPALSTDGACLVYPFRPITCRTMGIPHHTQGMVKGACVVQTSTPLKQLPLIFHIQEQRLADQEQQALDAMPETSNALDELLLPYGFLPPR